MTAMPVLIALDGMHGANICSVSPMPDASGAVHCVKFSVPVTVPVTVEFAVAVAVALARIENPQM
jgi:hypothetical protein